MSNALRLFLACTPDVVYIRSIGYDPFPMTIPSVVSRPQPKKTTNNDSDVG